ncbi:MAG: hypothetical protein VYC34_02475, partial [Planctomycetota bacterium]|nr:hypothetical protein [Planctomycetota bacterium]
MSEPPDRALAEGSRGAVSCFTMSSQSSRNASNHASPLMLSVSGCRGVVGVSLTPEIACRFAASFAAWLLEASAGKPGSIILARDGRAGGEVIHEAARAGLRGAGFHVIDLGIAATPTVGVMVDHHRAAGGMVVTASHNPQEWNGLKCIDPTGAAPVRNDAESIIR